MDFEALLQSRSRIDAHGANGLEVDYFDGQTPVRQALTLRIQGDTLIGLDEVGGERFRMACAAVRWPQQHRRGQRSALLANGAVVHARDAKAWDEWLVASGLRTDRLAWLESHRWAILGSLVTLVAAVFWFARFGLPWGAQLVARELPQEVAQLASDSAMHQLKSHWLRPTQIDETTQQRWRDRLAQANARWQSANGLPELNYRLHFVGGGALGANALALPSGDLLITDELLHALRGHDRVVLGVLAHELTHVRAQHGMRQIVQASLVGALIGSLSGDFSSILTTAATWASVSHYSREFEREADDGAIAFLHANGWSSADMAVLFERLKTHGGQVSPSSAWGTAFASHPSDAERVKRFEDAAKR